jgi:caa(3)-type oxidase subunit IV
MEPQVHTGEARHADDHGYRIYAVTWFRLLVITTVGVGITILPIPSPLIALGVVAMALAKVTLIMAYFMHLKFEHRALAYMIGIPMALIIVLYLALWPDTLLF